MKLEKSDIETLKQVSLLNDNLLIRKGSKKVMSITPMKTVLFVGELSDVPSYEYDLSLYSVSDLLWNLKFFDENFNLNLYVKKDKVEFFQTKFGKKKFVIEQADKSTLITPNTELEIDDLNYDFNLPKNIISLSHKLKNRFKELEIKFINQDENTVEYNFTGYKGCNQKWSFRSNKKNEVRQNFPEDFRLIFTLNSLATLKIEDYSVSVSPKNVSHFKSVSGNYYYWVALEPRSQFETKVKKDNSEEIIYLTNSIAKLQRQLEELKVS